MDIKVYTQQKKYTLADGTVKYCQSFSTYKPKGIKDAKKTDIIDSIRKIDDRDKLRQIKKFIEELNGNINNKADNNEIQ